MRSAINRYLIGASLIALTFSLTSNTANATCTAMPTCEELGYKQTSCTDGQEGVKCPFDKTKMRCLIPENTTCNQLGYYRNSGSCEGVFFDKVLCPIDKNFFRCEYNECNPIEYPINPREFDIDPDVGELSCCDGGLCKYLFCAPGYEKISVQANNHPGMMDICVPALYDCDNANIGDYYYENGKCCKALRKDKKVIGVVISSSNKLMMTVNLQKFPWNDGTEHFYDIPDLDNYTLDTTNQDTNGLLNSAKIILFAQSSGQTHQAAEYCYNFHDGGLTWYLPAAGQLGSFTTNYRDIRERYRDELGYAVEDLDVFWTSTEMDDYFVVSTDREEITKSPKNIAEWTNAFCVANYGDNAETYESIFNALNPSSPQEISCNVGDTYYSNDTCDQDASEGREAIGIVFDSVNKLVVSVEEQYPAWNDGSNNCQDIPTLDNYTVETAIEDMNGLSNTNTIVAFAQSSGQPHNAAQYCYDMTIGGKDWFLPSAGQTLILVDAILNEETPINLGIDLDSDKYFSSSTEYTSCDFAAVLKSSRRRSEMSMAPKPVENDSQLATHCIFQY